MRVGVLEIIASTAVLNARLRPGFWAELPFKRQLYSVMPQATCAWARRKGCKTFYATYVGLGRPENLLPQDLDLIFIATPTQYCPLAYALAAVYRRRGTSVVLAGPHARAYPEDCLRFADIVVTDCDETVVGAIVDGEVPPGTIVKSARPLADLPLVEERGPEIEAAAFVNGRRRRTTAISLLSSLGCPYDCDFCSEWKTRYTAFDSDRLAHELRTIAKLYPGALIGFHDPNFGVRFDETMSAFERLDRPQNPFVMEASLSLLNEKRLARLAAAGCKMTAPGIESWIDYSKKSRTTRVSGEAKYEAVSQKVREIGEFIPYIQTNIILGVDADSGDEPFELTERFIREHPAIWTNVNIPIPFGSTPFVEGLRRDGRLVEGLPFAFYTAPYLAIRPKHYSIEDYLKRMARLYDAMSSPMLLLRRLSALPSPIAKIVALARTAGLRAERDELTAFLRAYSRDRNLRRFHDGETNQMPRYYRERMRQRFGRALDLLPKECFEPVLPQPDSPPVVLNI